ncbi:MAG: hypothetical protein AAF577_08260 [Pseudomonadota bacterium]
MFTMMLEEGQEHKGNDMHPADELQAVREEIRGLRRREDALKRYFIKGPGRLDRRGTRWEVHLEEQHARVIDPVALPRQVLGDGRFWMDRVTQRVCLRAVGPPHAALASEPSPAASALSAITSNADWPTTQLPQMGGPKRHAKAREALAQRRTAGNAGIDGNDILA